MAALACASMVEKLPAKSKAIPANRSHRAGFNLGATMATAGGWNRLFRANCGMDLSVAQTKRFKCTSPVRDEFRGARVLVDILKGVREIVRWEHIWYFSNRECSRQSSDWHRHICLPSNASVVRPAYSPTKLSHISEAARHLPSRCSCDSDLARVSMLDPSVRT